MVIIKIKISRQFSLSFQPKRTEVGKKLKKVDSQFASILESAGRRYNDLGHYSLVLLFHTP